MKYTICQLTRLSQQMLVINPFVVVPPPLARAELHPLLVLNVPAGVGPLSPAAPDKTLAISVENAPLMLALVLSTKMTISSPAEPGVDKTPVVIIKTLTLPGFGTTLLISKNSLLATRNIAVLSFALISTLAEELVEA